MAFPKGFYIGAATAPHQVEGNNIHSDYWLMERLPGSAFTEPSGEACDHYHRYEEDIRMLKDAGLNTYRFGIEWARIEPEEGKYDLNEVEHYRKVIDFCRENDIEPIVTLMHFSSPKWLISKGGWAVESTIRDFAGYARFITEQLGDKLHYICTINEANIGLQITAIMKKIHEEKTGYLQVGMKYHQPEEEMKGLRAMADAFGIEDPMGVHPFLAQGTPEEDAIILRAHAAARNEIKEVRADFKVGLTLSLHHFDVVEGGEAEAERRWEEEFRHYLPVIGQDDFIGVQNYTREIIGPDGSLPVSEKTEMTQMDYEFYPEALEKVVRRVAEEYKGEILITENGVGIADDSRREEFIRRALKGVESCISDGLPVKAYLYWSLLDNFEWQAGYSKTFGLISVDRETQKRTPKPSLALLGSYAFN